MPNIITQNLSLIITIICILGVIKLGFVICKNPYQYPYCYISIDVSKKRKVQLGEEIEKYIIVYGFDNIKKHQAKVLEWEKQTETKVNRSILKPLRKRQYKAVRDRNNTYQVTLQRKQTRYSQTNYVKTSYHVFVVVQENHFSYKEIAQYYHRLDKINFETTTRKYHSKKQRNLMTPKIRKQIKERDRYTCQICGKYMHDEVGLHIDHIKPVSKGGKTVPSNLQVLCSKCNGRKSDK